MVSHNEELVSAYSDRIIVLKDGSVVEDKSINDIKDIGMPITKDISRRRKDKWIEQISLQNFKKRIKTHVFSIISLSICLVATILISGFARYSEETILTESKKKLDYGSLTISKEEKIELEGSIISLVQQSRPNDLEISTLTDGNTKFTYCNNYDVLLPAGNNVFYNDYKLDQLPLRPVYSFVSTSYDPTLLIKGSFPKDDTFNEIVINKQAYEYIQKETKKDVINDEITINHQYESIYYTFDQENNVIRDTYSLSKNLKIVGVVDELDFLSSPTIYFSYKAYIEFLESYLLNNLSTYLKKDVSWKERIDSCGDNDELSSYSIRAFVNDYKDHKNLKELVSLLSHDGLVATSLSLTVEDSLVDLVKASTTGMELFLAISIIGIILILGIISYYSYSQDRKRSAVLTALGASRGAITKIYLLENMFVGLFSYFVTIILSFPATLLANMLIKRITSINDLVRTPYYLLTNFKYDYLLLLLLIIITIVGISTLLPILFSKRISVSKELRDE